jgi:cob(I)alamin adenosyltransferase
MAIRINRVYTRSGDDGKTALVGGRRVAKDDARIAAYGDVDELNSVIGTVRAELSEGAYRRKKACRELDGVLAFIQQELFDLGSELATPPKDAYQGMIRIGDEQIGRLENFIDELQPELGPLKSFVLPSGGRLGAGLHVARTVCRRAERWATGLVRKGQAEPGTAKYLNRLSDLLFVQARWIALKTGHSETLWQHGLQPPGKSAKKVAKKKAGKARTVKTAKAKPTEKPTKKLTKKKAAARKPKR